MCNISPFLFLKDNITAIPVFGSPTLEVMFLMFARMCACISIFKLQDLTVPLWSSNPLDL